VLHQNLLLQLLLLRLNVLLMHLNLLLLQLLQLLLHNVEYGTNHTRLLNLSSHQLADVTASLVSCCLVRQVRAGVVGLWCGRRRLGG
jgi:hypothetical protein